MQLIFGDAKTDAPNLCTIDAESHSQPAQIVQARAWGSAPREISLSPDGNQMACLVSEFDSEGRPELRLWVIELKTGSKWELLYAFRRE